MDIIISISSLMMRALEVYSLSKVPVYNTVLLTML